MKNRKRYIIFIIILSCFSLYYFHRTDMTFVENGKVVFIYGDINSCETLSEKDLSIIVEMFDKKLLIIDMPACCFSENASIQFNDGEQIFCIANDDCPVIYWQNKDRYIELSENDNIFLRNLLRKYGLDCPCV